MRVQPQSFPARPGAQEECILTVLRKDLNAAFMACYFLVLKYEL